MLLGILLLCFLGTFYSPEFRDDTDSALEGPTGLTCRWNKSSRVQGENQTKKQKTKHKATGAMRRKTRTSWNPVCYVSWGHSGPLEWKLQRQRRRLSLCTEGVATSLWQCQLHWNSQCRFGLGFFSTYSCGPRSFRSLVCVDRMSLSTHCQAEVGGEMKKQLLVWYKYAKVVKKNRRLVTHGKLGSQSHMFFLPR